jgi:hypothetical protein
LKTVAGHHSWQAHVESLGADSETPTGELLTSLLDECATTLAAVVERLGIKSNHAACLVHAVAEVSNSSDLKEKAKLSLSELRTDAAVFKQNVSDLLSGSKADLSRYADITELASRLEKLRGLVWLDEFYPEAGVAKAVKAADTQAASTMETIGAKLDESNLSLVDWNNYIEQLERLRVLGSSAEKLYQKACSKRRAAIIPDHVDPAVELINKAGPPQRKDLAQIECVLKVVLGLHQCGEAALDDHELWKALESAKVQLTESLVALVDRARALLGTPFADIGEAAEQLQQIYTTLCAIFTVPVVPAMRGFIPTSESAKSSFPCIREAVDELQELLPSVANALEQRGVELSELIEEHQDTDSFAAMNDLKATLLQRAQHLDKLLEAAALESRFHTLRAQCSKICSQLRITARDKRNQDLDTGVAELDQVAAEGKITKPGSKIRPMIKALNKVDLAKYAEQLDHLAGSIQVIVDQFSARWQGVECASLADIVCMESNLYTIGMLKGKNGISSDVKEHLVNAHDVDIDALYTGMVDSLDTTFEGWEQRVQDLIRAHDYMNVDCQMSLLTKIIKGTGAGVPTGAFKDRVVEVVMSLAGISVHTLTPHGNGVGVDVIAEEMKGSRAYLKQVGRFGPPLLGQLDRLLNALRCDAKVRGSEFFDAIKHTTKSFRQMQAASGRPQESDVPPVKDARDFWAGEIVFLKEAVESALERTACELQPFLGSIEQFRNNIGTVKQLSRAGESLAANVKQMLDDLSETAVEATTLTVWADAQQKYNVLLNIYEKDSPKDTLTWKKEHDWEGYVREKEKMKNDITDAAASAEVLLESEDSCNISDELNKRRAGLEDVPDEIRQELKEDPNVYIKRMDTAMNDQFNNLATDIQGQFDTTEATKAAAKIVDLSRYDGLDKMAVEETLTKLVSVGCDHMEQLIAPITQAARASPADALGLISNMHDSVQKINDSQGYIRAIQSMVSDLQGDGFREVEVRRQVARGKEAAAAQEEVKKQATVVEEMKEKLQAFETEQKMLDAEVAAFKEDVEGETAELADAEKELEAADAACNLKQRGRTTAKGKLKRLEAAKGGVPEAKEKLAAAKKALKGHTSKSSESNEKLAKKLKATKAEVQAAEQEHTRLAAIAAAAKAAKTPTKQRGRSLDSATAIIQEALTCTSGDAVRLFACQVYADKDALCSSKKERDVERLKSVFSIDTTDQLRQLGLAASCADVADEIEKNLSWATAKIAELTSNYNEALALRDFDKYNDCYMKLDAFQDVKQPPAVVQCATDIRTHIQAARNEAQASLDEFKIGDDPSDVCEFVADKLARLQHIALRVPLVEDLVNEAINHLLDRFQLAQNVGAATDQS